MFKTEFGGSGNAAKYGGHSPDIVRLVPAGARVLDIGCSTGVLARELKAKGCRVVGVDIDPDSIARAAATCEAVHLCNLDEPEQIDALPYGADFDAITMGDVVEHLRAPGASLARLRRFLKPGGAVVASIPNSAFALLRLRFLLGDFRYSPGGGLMDEDHLHLFSFRTVRALMADSGYEVERIYGASVVRARFFFLAGLAKWWPALFALPIIVRARTR